MSNRPRKQLSQQQKNRIQINRLSNSNGFLNQQVQQLANDRASLLKDKEKME